MFDIKFYFFELISSISWNDILDILIVATIIYYLLKFLIGTRGWQILTGIGIILSLWYFAKLLKLKTVVWIFDNLWTVGIFFLIVLFQPEIRNALAKLGEKGFLGERGFYFNQSYKNSKKVIDEIVRASVFLAEKKIGALIVFERFTKLEHFLEGSCVELDALVSLELIINIFEPNTPLHDGAVIVKNNRIAYAKCVLPLTINTDIPSHLGTRHRAGLGIAEETDAVALIVSEERGSISIAFDGVLYSDLDNITVKKLLMEFLGVEKDKFRKELTKKLRIGVNREILGKELTKKIKDKSSILNKVNKWKS